MNLLTNTKTCKFVNTKVHKSIVYCFNTTCEWVCISLVTRAEGHSLSVVDDEVGHLVKKRLTELIAVKKLLGGKPGIFSDVVWQLEWWSSFLDIHSKYVIIFL